MNNHFSQVFARWNLNFEFVRSLFELLGSQRFVSTDTGLVLGLSSAWRHANPLELFLQDLLSSHGRLGFDG